MRPPRVRTVAALTGLACTALLSHLHAVVPAGTYFFRDFGMAFYPFHLFWARELAAGRWPFWNPYVHSGSPTFLIVYPIDLLHGFWPSPEAVSWLLTLHYPLAALGAFALARELGIAHGGAYVSGSAFALSGIAVASLNLYVFLQALAWTPLLAFAALRAARRGGRWIPAAALVLAVSLTTAQEFVLQGLVLGTALALAGPAPRLAAVRLCLAVPMGVALAGVPVAMVAGVLPETLRGQGFSVSRALDYSLHPAVLLQVLVRDFAGSLDTPLEVWWGHRFFTKGFPYFITLYLGPQVLALACAGVRAVEPGRRAVLGALGSLALLYAMGQWGGLAPLLAPLPVFRSFRFPSKALLLPCLVLVLLAGYGLDRLRRGAGWPEYRVTAAVSGLLSLGLAVLTFTSVDLVADWMWSDPVGNPILRATLGRDALVTAVVALLGVVMAAAVARGAVTPAGGSLVVAAVLILDLARAGAGVNPQTTPAFFQPLPEMAAQGLDALEGGRVFSYGTEHSTAFRAYLRQRPPDGLLPAYFVRRQMLAPHANVADQVEAPFSDDEGSFVLSALEIGPLEFEPRRVGEILPYLRNAAVSRVLSLDPLDHPQLQLLSRVGAGPPGLIIHVYAIRDAWPRLYVACDARRAQNRRGAFEGFLAADFHPSRTVHLEEDGTAACRIGTARRIGGSPAEDLYEVEADGPGYLVTRDTYARGWRATVDGRAERVLRAGGKHRAVPIPGGRHRVHLRYHPPGLRAGLVAMALGALAALATFVRPLLRSQAPGNPE